MRCVVIDTNVYVDWLNSRRHEEVLFQPETVKFLSAVVVLELYAGAFSAVDRKILGQITRMMKKAGRILVPSWPIYRDAGNVLRELQVLRGYNPGKSGSLSNDVLIALSARSIGATVVTQNGKDFLAIQEVRRFNVMVVK